MTMAPATQWRPSLDQPLHDVANIPEALQKSWPLDPALDKDASTAPIDTKEGPHAPVAAQASPALCSPFAFATLPLQTPPPPSISPIASTSHTISTASSSGSTSSSKNSSFSFSLRTAPTKSAFPALALKPVVASQSDPSLKLNEPTHSRFSFANSAFPRRSATPAAHIISNAQPDWNPLALVSPFASSRGVGFVAPSAFSSASDDRDPNRKTPAPVLESTSIPAKSRSSVPKAVADKVSQLETRSATINDEVEGHGRTLRIVNQDLQELRDRVEELETLNENLLLERDELTNRVDGVLDQLSDLSAVSAAQQEALEKFGALFEEMGGDAEVTAALGAGRAKKAKKALKGPRDNVLNVCRLALETMSANNLSIRRGFVPRHGASHQRQAWRARSRGKGRLLDR